MKTAVPHGTFHTWLFGTLYQPGVKLTAQQPGLKHVEGWYMCPLSPGPWCRSGTQVGVFMCVVCLCQEAEILEEESEEEKSLFRLLCQ